ncbi:MAG: hypothetical protein P4L10_09375, partial [Acidobacteriaceae bacterium]|nr:hypothetical protein [Acidobacteriaceae bacterium]
RPLYMPEALSSRWLSQLQSVAAGSLSAQDSASSLVTYSAPFMTSLSHINWYRKDRALHPLHVLLLILVKSGLATSYDLMTSAGMSVGLTSPAFKRLEKEKLLTHSIGPRNRTRYSLTEAGETQLQTVLSAGQQDYWGLKRKCDFESVHRAVLLAWIFSGKEEALRCIAWAEQKMKQQYKKEERNVVALLHEMQHLQRERDLSKDQATSGEDVAITYRWLKAASDAALHKQQAEVMQTMAGLVEQLPVSLQIPAAELKALKGLHQERAREVATPAPEQSET